jgi:hyperosmotically inducible periplasmic protein
VNKQFSSWAIVALLAVTVPALGACRVDRADDQRDVAAQVNDNLRTANLDDVRADWREDERELRLSGEVETQAERARAEELATQVVGTTGRIVNEVRVEGLDTGAMDQHIEERLEAMFEDRTSWAPLDFDRGNVSFDVEARVVTISGTVESQEVRDRIEERARNLEGVRDVVNQLEVDPDRRPRR